MKYILSFIKKNLISLKQRKGLRAQLLRGGVGSIALNVVNVALGLGMAVVLARNLGPDGYGVYTYVFALVSLLAIPAQFGIPALLVRETAKAEANEQWAVMRGLWRWAGFSAGTLSLVLVVAGGFLAWVFADQFSGVELVTFAWGLAFIPLLALNSVRGAALRGLRKVVQGQFPEQVIRPGLLIALILASSLFGQNKIGPGQAMALNVLATGLAFAMGAWLLRRGLPKGYLQSWTEPVYHAYSWFASALPFALISGVVFITTQIDIVMLGFFVQHHDIGIYRVASRGALLVGIGLVAMQMVVRPYFASLFTEGDKVKIQKLATLYSRVSLFLTVPPLIIYFVFGASILDFVFGSNYVLAYFPLLVLSVGQLIRAAMGEPTIILEMGGFEKKAATGTAIAALLNIFLNLYFIPAFGMNGAAFATTISIFIRNLILWKMARLTLQTNSTVFARKI